MPAPQLRSVSPGRGWQWIVEGFALFRKSPLNWIAQCVALVALFWLGTLLGLLGVLALNLLYPVFLAGLMAGCRSLDQGGRLRLDHVFSAFRGGAAPLVSLGGFALVAQLAITFLVMALGGPDFNRALAATQHGLDAVVKVLSQMDAATLARVQLAGLISLAVNLPLLMALWYSPLAVAFDKKPLRQALLESVLACLKNLLPFLVYGAALAVLTVVALLPAGIGLFLLVPTVFGSIYASYKDVFAASASGAAEAPSDSA